MERKEVRRSARGEKRSNDELFWVEAELTRDEYDDSDEERQGIQSVEEPLVEGERSVIALFENERKRRSQSRVRRVNVKAERVRAYLSEFNGSEDRSDLQGGNGRRGGQRSLNEAEEKRGRGLTRNPKQVQTMAQ